MGAAGVGQQTSQQRSREPRRVSEPVFEETHAGILLFSSSPVQNRSLKMSPAWGGGASHSSPWQPAVCPFSRSLAQALPRGNGLSGPTSTAQAPACSRNPSNGHPERITRRGPALS